MSYFGNNDPANPSHLNPDGSSNQAYFARQEEERRRREAEEAERKRRQEESDRFQREQSERFALEARNHHQRVMEEQAKSQQAASQASQTTYSPTYTATSSTSSRSSSSSDNRWIVFVIFAIVAAAIFLVTIYIPYQLGIAVGIERSSMIGRWGWWSALGIGVGGMLVFGLSTSGIASWLNSSRSIETVSKPGVAFASISGFLGSAAGPKFAPPVLVYFILVSFSLMVITMAGVRVMKEVLLSGRSTDSSPGEDWYSLLRSAWAWLAIVVMVLLAIPFCVGIGQSLRHTALSPYAAKLTTQVEQIVLWPRTLGNKFASVTFVDHNYWLALREAVLILAVAIWWGLIAFVLTSLMSPKPRPSWIAASAVGSSVVITAVVSMLI